ncbi:MAG: glycosyltransferase [bacterium]|nr:glycosyltransferase [bacterium]
MKLLIITQKVDQADTNLGFFHRWLQEFSKNTDELFVIGGSVGASALPPSVHVYSLGKEKGYGRIARYIRFYWHCITTIPRVDAVFVHMIPAWVLLVWPVAFVFRKKIFLWYTHKSVTLSLRIAARLVTRIFTASKESCRLLSPKIVITGHGIDTKHFVFGGKAPRDKFRILTVGRIASSKGHYFLLEVIQELRKEKLDKPLSLTIVGETITNADKAYEVGLKKYVNEHQLGEIVTFAGGKAYTELPKIYDEHTLMVHASVTGSVDKVVIESMACGLPVVTTSEAYQGILPVRYIATNKLPGAVAKTLYDLRDIEKDMELRNIVEKDHAVENVVRKIMTKIYE